MVLERNDMAEKNTKDLRRFDTFSASGQIFVHTALVYSVFVHSISSSDTWQWIPRC